MPGRLFQPAIRARLSGRSRGKFPRIASRLGCWRAASIANSLELGSHPGGWITAASTPASSISFSRSSFEKLATWRWLGFVGLLLAQMWTCASTTNMAYSFCMSCVAPDAYASCQPLCAACGHCHCRAVPVVAQVLLLVNSKVLLYYTRKLREFHTATTQLALPHSSRSEMR